MDARQFFELAEALTRRAEDAHDDPTGPALCRTAISRAYYAVFLTARQWLDALGLETHRVASPHATFEQALSNSGVLTLQRLANSLRSLCSDRTTADYELGNLTIEATSKARAVIETARGALLQFEIVAAGGVSPPIDRSAVLAAILAWARANSKPLWKKEP